MDQRTGTIILVFCRDNKEVFTLQSSDDGLTWGSMTNITAVVNGGGWGFVGTGPPGGIQLPSGRLIIGLSLYSNYSCISVNVWTSSLAIRQLSYRFS